jgi:hypothetical protein
MNHHGSGDAHDGLDCSFCNTIMMMGSDSSKLDGLGEFE